MESLPCFDHFVNKVKQFCIKNCTLNILLFFIIIMNSYNSFFLGTPYLALTGTADKNTQSTIIKSLSMVNPKRIVISPERKNLLIAVVKCRKSDMFTNLDWLVDMIRNQGKNMPKTIIFCNMMSEMAAVTNYLLLKLGCDAYHEKECIIDIFHSTCLGQKLRRNFCQVLKARLC